MTALRYMVDTQRIAFVLVGFLGVFVGSFLYNAAAKRKNKKRLTDCVFHDILPALVVKVEIILSIN